MYISQDPWVPLIQKYMQILEKKSTSLASSRESQSTTSTSTSSSDANSKTQLAPRGSRHVKANKDEHSLLQKELDKAYERISSLEVCYSGIITTPDIHLLLFYIKCHLKPGI